MTTASNGGQTKTVTNAPRIATQPPAAAPAVVAPPPDPKIQAIGFALELAKVRANAAIPGNRETDVDLLIADATTIAKYIGPNQVQTTLSLRG